MMSKFMQRRAAKRSADQVFGLYSWRPGPPR